MAEFAVLFVLAGVALGVLLLWWPTPEQWIKQRTRTRKRG